MIRRIAFSFSLTANVSESLAHTLFACHSGFTPLPYARFMPLSIATLGWAESGRLPGGKQVQDEERDECAKARATLPHSYSEKWLRLFARSNTRLQSDDWLTPTAFSSACSLQL